MPNDFSLLCVDTVSYYNEHVQRTKKSKEAIAERRRVDDAESMAKREVALRLANLTVLNDAWRKLSTEERTRWLHTENQKMLGDTKQVCQRCKVVAEEAPVVVLVAKRKPNLSQGQGDMPSQPRP